MACRLKWLRIDDRALGHLLRAFDHDAVAGFQTALNDPIGADLRTDFDFLHVDGIRPPTTAT